MNKECIVYRDSLRGQFDAGVNIADIAHEHVTGCAECSAYRDELVSVRAALFALPLEIPRNALTPRIKSRLEEERAYSNDARWWLPAAALCACTLFVGAISYFAIPIDPWTWWDYARGSGTSPQWMLREFSIEQEIVSAQEIWSGVSGLLAAFPTPFLVGVAAACGVLLVAINASEAYRLRIAGDRTVQQGHWR